MPDPEVEEVWEDGVVRLRLTAADHRPEHAGRDGLGYGRCQAAGCGQLWPCGPSRGLAPIVRPAPDAERDARVAERRAVDARRAGRALDELMARRMVVDANSYKTGWQDGYAASEEHHKRDYGALPGFHDDVCTGPGVPAGFNCSHPSHAGGEEHTEWGAPAPERLGERRRE